MHMMLLFHLSLPAIALGLASGAPANTATPVMISTLIEEGLIAEARDASEIT